MPPLPPRAEDGTRAVSGTGDVFDATGTDHPATSIGTYTHPLPGGILHGTSTESQDDTTTYLIHATNDTLNQATGI